MAVMEVGNQCGADSRNLRRVSLVGGLWQAGAITALWPKSAKFESLTRVTYKLSIRSTAEVVRSVYTKSANGFTHFQEVYDVSTVQKREWRKDSHQEAR